MRPFLALISIFALCALGAHAQEPVDSTGVLAAIAADAGAPTSADSVAPQPDAAPAPAAPAAPEQIPHAVPEPDLTTSNALAETASAAPSARAAAPDAAHGTCSIGRGEHWQNQPNLTLAQCATALVGSNEPYDHKGLRSAYWSGVYLAASRSAVYQSRNGSDWSLLSLTDAE